MKGLVCAILLVLLETACSRSAQSCLERGNGLFRAGKFQDAQLEYRASIAKDPRSPEAYYRLGLTDTALGDGDAAFDAFQRAVRFGPDNDQYAIALADLSLEAYQEEPDQKSYDQVRQETYALLRKNPDSFDGLRLHGELLLIDRKYEEALRELRKAEAMRPLDPKVDVPMVRALFAESGTGSRVYRSSGAGSPPRLRAHVRSAGYLLFRGASFRGCATLARTRNRWSSQGRAPPAEARCALPGFGKIAGDGGDPRRNSEGTHAVSECTGPGGRLLRQRGRLGQSAGCLPGGSEIGRQGQKSIRRRYRACVGCHRKARRRDRQTQQTTKSASR